MSWVRFKCGNTVHAEGPGKGDDREEIDLLCGHPLTEDDVTTSDLINCDKCAYIIGVCRRNIRPEDVEPMMRHEHRIY